ncbi:MAG: nuclear transport factor 2 family protein [Flavobacteriaceae bacterium]|nr:nuclear transport factor 2 family protein [Flavobacteriaceae bacterium]
MRKRIYLMFLTLLIVGCKNNAETTEAMAQVISSDQNTLENVYSPDAIKIIDSKPVLNGLGEISEYYKNENPNLMLAESRFRLGANESRGIFYEILEVKTSKSETLLQLVIWQENEVKELKVCEFEVVSENFKSNVLRSEIDKRRDLWMSYCNAHDVEALVNEVYSANTMYYNHRPLVQGREALIKEYGYMNSPNYSLELNPIIIEVVNKETVFEIGQCKGSYNGKYILVWKKDPDGQWRIFFDSNI